MKRFLFVVLLFYSFSAIAQNDYDRTWALGWKNRQEDTIIYSLNIFFDKDGIKYTTKKRDIIINKYNTTGNDKNGNLQFYSNGCLIYNKYDTLMKNGDKINIGSTIDDPWCLEDKYLPCCFQQALILPINDSVYYMLHQHSEFFTGFGTITDRLLYSKINTATNNGQGIVLEKNKTIFNDYLDVGHLTAVKKANGKDWWIVQPKYQSTDYYIVSVSEKGFENKIISTGLKPDSMFYGSGSGFSPNGKKYARYDNWMGIFLFDFDREKGILSDGIKLSADTLLQRPFGIGSICFSPDSRYLYVANQWFLYQFDTYSNDIQKSKIIVANRTKTPLNNLITMQQGADCKIYVTSLGGEFFHVIENPNEKGANCNFKIRGLKLPVYLTNALPYFPNYRLGTPDEHWCDSIVKNKDVEKEQFMACAVYPNPAYEQVNVDLFGYIQSYQQGNWQLYDATGTKAASFPILQGHDQYNFDISFLPQGLYVWNLVLDGKIRQVGKLIKME